ncbi:hypothetical protein PAGU2595_002630 [Lysobacter xanthus]
MRERALALGLLLLVLGVAYLCLIHPWWTVPMREVDDRIAQLRERDARLRAELAQAPLVQARLQEAQQRLAGRPGFLPEATAELAVAGLVQRLETVVAQASPGNRSCQINNRSPLQGGGNEPYTRVAVQVRLHCGTPETAAVLYALEAGTPRLFVENLNILAQRFFFTGGPEAAGREGGLDVSFDLVGYLRPAGALADGGGAPAAAPVAPVAPVAPSPAPSSGAGPMPSAPPSGMSGPSSASPPQGAPTAGPGMDTPPPSGGPDAP